MKKIISLFLFFLHLPLLSMDLDVCSTISGRYAIAQSADKPSTWIVKLEDAQNPNIGDIVTVQVQYTESGESYYVQAEIVALGQNPQPTE